MEPQNMKNELSTFEKILLQEEEALFRNNLESALLEVQAVFARYYEKISPITKSFFGLSDVEIRKELDRYLVSLLYTRCEYQGGYEYVTVNVNTSVDLPKRLKEALLKRKIADTLKKLKYVVEVRTDDNT